MLQSKLSTIVQAVRFRYAVLFALSMAVVYHFAIYSWMSNWGSTEAERQMALPGDELSPGAKFTTKAVTIDATPEVIWQWLAQVGQDKAGFYTYTWIENLLAADIHNTDEIRPEWQQIGVGDAWRLVAPDYLGGMGEEMASPVLISDPGRALVLEMWGAHVILPVDEDTSRLLVRGEATPANLVVNWVAEPAVFTLSKRMYLGLKARAEGRPDAPAALMAIAHLGWAAAGIAVAWIFLTLGRRRYWMALPIAASLLPVVTTGDLLAGLAAFLASGIPLLGFLVYGRSWWGMMVVIASTVLLVLLQAPEAYTAFGVVFCIILLAALAVKVTSSRSVVDRNVYRLEKQRAGD